MPKATLTISSKNYSSWSLRGWLLARMSGLDFDERVVPIDDPANRAELLLLSPSVLVPSLCHDGATVWDTLAIAEYLNEIRPDAKLLPEDRVARARCRAICGEMHSGFANLRSALPMNLMAHYPDFNIWAGARADIDRIVTIWRECLADSGGPFLFGALTMADAMYAPVVTRFLTYDVALDDACAAYAQHIMALPMMREWIEAARAEPTEIDELDIESSRRAAGRAPADPPIPSLKGECPKKFGVVIPIWRLTTADAERMTMRAEELGWDGVFVPDHIMAKPATTEHYGPSWPDPFSLLAFLAGRTRRIRVGASVIVLPYRNPLVAAKAAATVDQVSNGRFIFGIGVGWDEAEFTDLGLPFAERGKMTDEYLAIIKTAWGADVPSYAGHYLKFSGATFAPRPKQSPHPPIWAGGAPGALSAPAMRRAATQCDAWHPLGLGWADLEKGMATVRELAARAGRPKDAVRFAPRNTLGLAGKAAGSGRAPYEGDPAQVAADVKRAKGLDCDWLTFDMPKADVPGMLDVMERFARDVKPQVG